MRYKEIINELFIQPAAWTQTRNDPKMKSYEFAIKGYAYEVDIVSMTRYNGGWGIAFDQVGNEDDYKMTGTGNAALVLATVMDIMKQFVHEVKPTSLRFSADSKEPSRVSLYRRMIGKLVPNEYTVSEHQHDEDIVFVLQRKDINEETLNELVGVKKFRGMTATEIQDWIDNNLGKGDARVLGRGAHGSAIMLGQNVYKLWLQDSAYEDFVNYALEHTGNPFLPQFLSGIKQMPAFFLKHKQAPDYVNYIRMEKLTLALGKNFYVFNLTNGLTLNWHQALEVFYDLQRYNNATDIPSNLNYITTLISEQLGTDVTQEHLPLDLMTFLHTLMDIRNLGHSLDIHHMNFMMRGKQLVILDPIKNESDNNLNHQFHMFDRTHEFNKR